MAAQPRRRESHRGAPTVITKREQFHSNIIGQSVTLAARSAQPDRATTD